jgi:AraC-like DNA-binding protein
MLSNETLWQGALAWIGDVRCDCRESGFGQDEVSPRPAVVYPRWGTFVHQAGGRSTVADPGHALFFNGGEPYRVRHPAPGGDRCTVVVPAEAVLEELASAGLMGEVAGIPRFPLRVVATQRREDLVQRRLVDGLRAGALGRLEVEEETLGLLEGTLACGVGVRRTAERMATRRRHRLLAERVRELIACDPGRELPLASIARAVGCSPYHLTRVFRAHVGVPVHRYQNRLRLRLALERISTDGQDLTEVALDLGFYDHSHFTNAFRRELRCRPSDWRRRDSGGSSRPGPLPSGPVVGGG